MLFFKKLASVLVSMILILVSGGIKPPEIKEPVLYPFVMVHGMGGWGTTSSINSVAPYWGATTGNLIEYLNEKGYDCHAASVGPFSSAWDRACELYAQLTGTTVDYGAAHSAEYGHARFGRTYEKPLFEGWGEPDANGDLKKVNLYGHSFGGATVRILAHLLAYGNREEIAATASDEISPLFTGNKADWIFSVTTLAAPHNGTTLLYTLNEDMINTIIDLFYAGVSLIGSTDLNDIIDMQLLQFGFSRDNGRFDLAYDRIMELAQTQDNVFHDLTLDGAKQLNSTITTVPGVYYFSFAVQGTIKNESTGFHEPTADMLNVLMPPATLMGKYSANDKTDYPINEDWLPNDGLVNTISSYAPFIDASTEYIEGAHIKGVWQKMPLTYGDHGSVIGLMAETEETRTFYMNHMDMINSLT